MEVSGIDPVLASVAFLAAGKDDLGQRCPAEVEGQKDARWAGGILVAGDFVAGRDSQVWESLAEAGVTVYNRVRPHYSRLE